MKAKVGRNEFKDTEIGRIPKEWEVVRLGDITLPVVKIDPRKESGKEFKYVDITSIENNRIIGWNVINSKNAPSRARQLIHSKDVIFATTRPYLKNIAVASQELDGQICSTGFCVIRPNKECVISEWIFYNVLTERFISRTSSKMKGATYPAVSDKDVSNEKIPLPSLPEQRKITEILSTVDEAIQRVDEAIARTERLKRGLMQRLLTRGIGHREFKDTEIGRIPKGWEVVRVGDIIEEIKNGFASGKRDEKGIVQIRMNNVTTDGRLIFDSYLKVPIPENLDEWLLKKGDFLFNNTNSYDLVGKSTIFNGAPFPCTFSNHFTRIRFKKEVLPELILHHFIVLWEKGYFKSVAIRHVGQSAVHTDYLLKLQLPLPSPPEQHRIIEILSTVDKKLELERKRKEKLERIKRGLMNDLLTGRKRDAPEPRTEKDESERRR